MREGFFLSSGGALSGNEEPTAELNSLSKRDTYAGASASISENAQRHATTAAATHGVHRDSVPVKTAVTARTTADAAETDGIRADARGIQLRPHGRVSNDHVRVVVSTVVVFVDYVWRLRCFRRPCGGDRPRERSIQTVYRGV